jgi:hypothetical protein
MEKSALGMAGHDGGKRHGHDGVDCRLVSNDARPGDAGDGNWCGASGRGRARTGAVRRAVTRTPRLSRAKAPRRDESCSLQRRVNKPLVPLKMTLVDGARKSSIVASFIVLQTASSRAVMAKAQSERRTVRRSQPRSPVLLEPDRSRAIKVFVDSLLERDGFEPSVPGDTPWVPSWKMSIILQSLPAGYPRVRRCGDVMFRLS